MVRLLRFVLKCLLGVVFYWCAVMFAIVAIRLLFSDVSRFESVPILIGVGAFLAGLFFFRRFRLRRVYVFGHEMTHYLVAKLFLRDTGKMRLGASGGSVEVDNPNVWITLSPYFVPFYVVIFQGIFCVLEFFWRSMPKEVLYVAGGLVGISWAYHLMLTLYALSQTQEDIKIDGPFFSYGVIAAGNVLGILIAVLILTQKWSIALSQFLALVQIQAEAVERMFG